MKSRFTIILLIGVTMLIASACRSRVKPKVAPTPTAVVMPPPPPTVVVESPERDFKPPVPSAARDEVASASSSDELNRLARQRGWIEDAFFALDRSALTPVAQESLARSAQWLLEHPQIALTIEGHCDERGTEQYNLALGDRRASTAREYLETRGVDASRLNTISYGEERPFAPGSNEDAWSQNRRAHLLLRRE